MAAHANDPPEAMTINPSDVNVTEATIGKVEIMTPPPRRTRSTIRQGPNRPFWSNRPNRPTRFPFRRTTPTNFVAAADTASQPININLALYLYNDKDKVSVPIALGTVSTTVTYSPDYAIQYDDLTDTQVSQFGGLSNFKPLHQKEQNKPKDPNVDMDLF